MEQEAGVIKPLTSPTAPSEHVDNPSTTHKSGGNDVSLETGLRPDDPGEERFYDCEESLDTPDDSEQARHGKRDTEETRQHTEASGNGRDQMQGTLKGPEDTIGHVESGDESLPHSTDATPEEPTDTGRDGEDETWDERIEDNRTPDGDSDSEMKAKGDEVEFDDEYLREVEESLTEEEKVCRRQESLAFKEEGNTHFKGGEHGDAERSYTSALGLCPVCYSKDRAVLFANRAAARLHLDLKEKAIADCSRAIELDPDYVKAILRRAELYEKTDKLDEALEDFKRVLERDPGHHAARQACMRLPRQIEERNEKLKEEMMSKLKDLGNMFLRPFGLSTNNFQLNQDANTGSYSVNFVQNPNNNNNNNG